MRRSIPTTIGLFISCALAQNECYYAADKRAGSAIIPCGPSGTPSACCQIGDLCLRYEPLRAHPSCDAHPRTVTAHAGTRPTTSLIFMAVPTQHTKTLHVRGSAVPILVCPPSAEVSRHAMANRTSKCAIRRPRLLLQHNAESVVMHAPAQQQRIYPSIPSTAML